MSWIEELEVPWPIEVLTRLGYDHETAERLHVLLPPVEVGIIPLPDWSKPLHLYEGGDNPAAAIVWALHGPNGSDAVRIASSGRDVLDLVAILGVVEQVYPGRFWTPSKVEFAASWADTEIPTERAARYIAAGIAAREASDLEADPATRPSDDQLALLAALLTPADPT